MSRYHSYLNTATKVIQQYQGAIPLAAWLKNFYKQHKQIGGNDRKQISQLVYNYYRVNAAFTEHSIEQKILLGAFLCNEATQPILEILQPNLNASIHLSLVDKLASLNLANSPTFFPFIQHISKSINQQTFVFSHVVQPDLFIRIRKQKQAKIIEQLQQQQIAFTQITNTCFALPNASKIDSILAIDQDVVIQDYASQQVGNFLQQIPTSARQPIAVWDCCAASGGKSILAKDILQHIKLTVSDVRQSILQNLQNRFEKAGINYYYSFVANLEKPLQQSVSPFQLIICDAPCSGSGTWGRTPEQLCFFNETKIQEYAILQQKIVSHALPHVAVGGYFLYITCSVFEAENEGVTNFIQQQFPNMQLLQQQTIIGYTNKADTMYAALFQSIKSKD